VYGSADRLNYIEYFSFLNTENLVFTLESLINLTYRHEHYAVIFSLTKFHNIGLYGMPFLAGILFLK
jgi:hypothetical protein